MRNILLVCLALIFLAAGVAVAGSGKADYPPRMTISKLSERMNMPGLTIVDVRTEKAYSASKVMIPGAIRIAPGAMPTQAPQWEKAEVYVLYCA
jgi:hypothetical protein